MQANALDASEAQGCEAEVVLEVSKFSFYGAAAVQVSPFGSATLDRRVGLNRPLRSGMTGAMPRSWHSEYTRLLS